MDAYTKESYGTMIVITIVSSFSVLEIIKNGYIDANVTIPIYFTIVAILLSYVAVYSQGRRAHREEEIRQIEKSLENFYRPLQNLFIECEQNPMDCYQKQKIKYLEIGCYRHLAEPRALLYFEKCPQDEESLKELIKQVIEDINMLQKKYEEKSNNKGFWS